MITLSFFCFSFVVLLIFIHYNFFVKGNNWFDAINIFIFFNFLYVAPLCLSYIYELQPSYSMTYMYYEIEPFFGFSVFYTSLALFIMYLFYMITPGRGVVYHFFLKFNGLNIKKGVFGGFSILNLVLSVIIFYIQCSKHGGFFSVLMMGYGVTEIFLQSPFIPISLLMIGISSFLFLCEYKLNKNHKYLVGSLIVFILVCLIYLILGRRSSVVTYGLSYIIFFSLLVRKINFKLILPILFSGFVFLNFVGLVRDSNYADFNDIYSKVEDQSGKVNDDKNKLFYTITDGQFAIPYETLPVLMSKINSSDYYYGYTLLNIPIQWIPRFILPEKNYGLARWYYQKFYNSESMDNEGRQFFYLSEGFLNFGLLGVLLWGAIWGVILKKINILKDSGFLGKYFFSIAVASSIILVSGDLTALFVVLIKTNFIWFFIPYFIILLFNRVQR